MLGTTTFRFIDTTMRTDDSRDAWKKIIQGLAPSATAWLFGERCLGREVTGSGYMGSRRDFSGTAYIHIVEWVSASVVILRWRDSRSGVYGEQRWVARRSRRSNRCALTGQAIRRGDLVFRPSFRERFIPSNWQVEILAEPLRELKDAAAVKV
jgi:hypothetical protein